LRRVAITGAGCVTAMGVGLEAFREALWEGRSGIAIDGDIPAAEIKFRQTARVRDYDPAAELTAGQQQIAERCSGLAVVASREAIRQAGLTTAYAGERTAVVTGCSTGGRSAEEPETARIYTRGGRVHPLTVPRSMASTGASLISMEHGLTGPAYTISTACASGAHAIGQAFHMVRSGMVDAAVTGGHEAPLTYGFLKAWDSLRVVSPTRCRPFTEDRDGITLAEGAAMFCLEPLEAAQARGADVLAELIGFGMSSDAHHITQPTTAGPAAAMRQALADAGVDAADVGYVNAHGTGTRINDAVEAEVLRMLFGEKLRTLPVSSTKGLHGHAMGASGAIELLATVLAVREGRVPGNAGLEDGVVDASLGLQVPTEAREASGLRLALSNSFAFGGLNAVLLVRQG
jgi:nodulation protein E